MTEPIEVLRDIVTDHDAKLRGYNDLLGQKAALVDTVAQLTAQIQQQDLTIQELRKIIEELQRPPPVLLFSDDFTELPKEGRLAYAIDAAPGSMSLVPGGLQVKLGPGQLNPQGKAKAEFGPRLGEKAERYGRIPFGVKRWHGLTITLPMDWQRDGNKVPLIDFHGTEDEGDKFIGRNASLSVFAVGDHWVGWRLWNDKPVQTGNENRIESFREPYKRGVPTRFIFCTTLDWRPDGVGRTEIWMVEGTDPPKKVFDESGPNAYNDKEGAYYKAGMYFPSANAPLPWPAGVGPKVAVFSRLRIGGPDATLESML